MTETNTAILVLPTFEGQGRNYGRDAEARGLVEAIHVRVAEAIPAPLRGKPDPSTLLGHGKIDEIAEVLEETGSSLVVVDSTLSPVQQRNLERALSAKVLDRTGLILEIFGARARTKEGRLQSQLAHLRYQKSRLVRSWTHLERQRGGAGFMGGPGETQIEADRRMLSEQIDRLERKLQDVRRTRSVQRAGRAGAERPVVAIIGYTNAGKSTLFNALANAGVAAKDQVFQTLDPTLRVTETPAGRPLVLADTVGFVTDLPTLLVDAFRATLEEAAQADMLIHVRDVANPDFEAHGEAVREVLAELGVDEDDTRPVFEAWNKADLLDEENLSEARFLARQRRQATRHPSIAKPWPLLTSAEDGSGLDELLSLVDAAIDAQSVRIIADMDPADSEPQAWLAGRGYDVNVDADEHCVRMAATLSRADHGRFRKRFPNLRAHTQATSQARMAAE